MFLPAPPIRSPGHRSIVSACAFGRVEHDTLYLDVLSRPYTDNLSNALHHELFHILDIWQNNYQPDERWVALNQDGFKYSSGYPFGYGGGGASVQNFTRYSIQTDKFPGFLNEYSTMAAEEDKAEVFAHLLMNTAYVEERMKADVVLRAKVKRMKELVADFCPDAGAAFWEKAKRTDRRPASKGDTSRPAAGGNRSAGSTN